jgi:hypothetical protein
MNTYFVYIDNPKYPEKIQKILANLKAKEYSKVSWIFESDLPIQTLFRQLGVWVRKGGFIFLIDVALPQQEMYWPTEGRNKLQLPHSDLDSTVAQFLAEIENDN